MLGIADVSSFDKGEFFQFECPEVCNQLSRLINTQLDPDFVEWNIISKTRDLAVSWARKRLEELRASNKFIVFTTSEFHLFNISILERP